MSELILSEARLLDIMAEVRRELQAEANAFQAPIGAPHLTFARSRELALNAARWLEEERAHVAACPVCTKRVADFQRHLPHPSRWEILFWELGLSGDEQQQRLNYHIEEGMCQQCQEQRRALQAAREAFRLLPEPLRLHNPELARETTAASAEARATSTDPRLEGSLDQHHEHLRLNIRADSPVSNDCLVSYAILGTGMHEPHIGFVVLGAENLYSAMIRLPLTELYTRLGGQCRLLVMPGETDSLSDAEHETLLASAESARSIEPERKSWLSWAENILRHQPDTKSGALAEAVKSRLLA